MIVVFPATLFSFFLSLLLPSFLTRNVRFRYPARPDALVFRSFKLTVEAGTTVALVCTTTVYNIVPPTTVMTLVFSVPCVYTSNGLWLCVMYRHAAARLCVTSCQLLFVLSWGNAKHYSSSSFHTDVLSAGIFVVVWCVVFARYVQGTLYTVCMRVRRSFWTFHAPLDTNTNTK